MSEESDEIDEIWGLYAEEGDNSLNTVEAALLTLRDQPDDSATVAKLFRAMHTYKGGARSMGLSVIESRAHLAEDLIGLVRDAGVRPDQTWLDLLLGAVDALRDMLEWSVSTRSDADPAQTEALITSMTRWRDQQAQPADDAGRCTNPPPLTDAEEQADALDDLFAGWSPAAAAPPESAGVAPAPVDVAVNDGSQETPEVWLQDPDDAPQAIVFEPLEPTALGDDPVYREIFSGMAQETQQAVTALLEAQDNAPSERHAAVVEEAQRLLHAAEQLGMAQWQTTLTQLVSAAPAELIGAVDALRALYERDFGGGASTAADPSPHNAALGFAQRMVDPLQTLVYAGELAKMDADSALEAAQDALAALQEPAAAAGFVRLQDQLADFIAQISAAGFDWTQRFPALLCALYEELVAVQELAELDGAVFPLDVKAQLQQWCAERVFENLLVLGKEVSDWKSGDAAQRCERVRDLLTQIRHACRHYGLESAAHLSVALTELFFQVESGGAGVDALLLRLVRAYGADMEVIMNAIAVGEAPDTAAIEKLLLDASGVMLDSSGTVSSGSIEARLGLPKSFHKVLTPESIATALEALDAGLTFYLVRTDLNRDEALAEAFLEWITSGAVRVISNVTVMEAHHTRFDFLLASTLAPTALVEALLELDASGELLALQATLTDRKAEAGEDDPSIGHKTSEAAGAAGLELFADLLDSLGELVTTQAMLHHLAGDLAQKDLPRRVGKLLAQASVDDAGLVELLETAQENLDRLLHLSQHSRTLLQNIQEQALTARLRPAALLLKPLTPWVAEIARRRGAAVELSVEGAELTLDQSLLEGLKAPLRRLLDDCITRHSADAGPLHLHVVLSKFNDHVRVRVQNDATNPSDDAPTSPVLAQIRANLKLLGGDLKITAQPDTGACFTLTLPLSMAVLEGMVVSVDRVHYVVPLEAVHRIVNPAQDRLLTVAAEDGERLLRLDEDLIPIRRLQRGATAQAGSTADASLDTAPTPTETMDKRALFVVVGDTRQRKTALQVDELMGQQQVLIRPLQGYLTGIRGVSGCALLGNGDVGLVLDMSE